MITITTPITEQDLVLMETILFDLAEKTKDELDVAPKFYNPGRQRGATKYPGYITRDAIYNRIGGGNYLAFTAACKKVKVKNIINDGKRCYIPVEYADSVESAMKHIMGME